MACHEEFQLQDLLGYSDWRNFINAIDKAKQSCETTGQLVFDHFVDVNKMVRLGSGSERQVDDIMLTRYACYLIAQNGDPKKEQIAFAQSYFAIQTRKQELIEERILLNERLQAREKLVVLA
jgi:DNA-damage-inducible protein D